MKNIHILPTDKPSRLISDGDELMFLYEVNYDIHNWGINRHIYITSDEEIKEGDWYLDTFNTQRIKANQFSDHKHYGNACKKIILTTDPDLIQYNVQAIDDKFLEWFVKNPSCEEVDVANSLVRISSFDWRTDYKIIIPKEEPKQETENLKNFKKLVSDEISPAMKDFIKEKQETLEEASKEWVNQNISKFADSQNTFIKAFINGAKWQAERIGLMEIELNHTKRLLASCEKALEERDKQIEERYSEEEVRLMLSESFKASQEGYDITADSIIEQFKNK